MGLTSTNPSHLKPAAINDGVDETGHVYKYGGSICFDGNESENEGCHVSVYFSIVETDSLPEGWKINAIFSFFVRNQLLDNYLCFRGTTRRFNAVTPKWGLSKLISIRSLIDQSKGYVVDNCCVFGAEVFVIKTQRVNECLNLIKDASPHKRDWKISDFSKLGDVWNSEEFEVGDHMWMVEVELYSKGSSSLAENRFMSIFVECVDSKDFAPHQKVKAGGFMRIKNKLNKLNNIHHSLGECWFSSSSQAWGLYEFSTIAYMRSRGFLVDDCCFLEVEITVQALALDVPKMIKSS